MFSNTMTQMFGYFKAETGAQKNQKLLDQQLYPKVSKKASASKASSVSSTYADSSFSYRFKKAFNANAGVTLNNALLNAQLYPEIKSEKASGAAKAATVAGNSLVFNIKKFFDKEAGAKLNTGLLNEKLYPAPTLSSKISSLITKFFASIKALLGNRTNIKA